MNINTLIHSTVRILTPTLIGAAAVLANVSPAMAAIPTHIQPAAHPVFSDCVFTSTSLSVKHKDNGTAPDDGRETLVQTNGSTISGFGDQFVAPGHHGDTDILSRGTASGKISSKTWEVDFTVTPKNPGAKTLHYQGNFNVDDGPLNGSVTGGIWDAGDPYHQKGHWTAAPGSVKCTKTMVDNLERVEKASDVYDAPDGKGNKILVNGQPFFLQPGRYLKRVEPCRQNWCHLQISEVPGGTGWVYQGEGFLTP